MAYVPFTDDQIQCANTVNLEDYLIKRGEKLLRSGREKRMSSNHSVTIRGCQWYDHATGRGGYAIDFLQEFYNLPFPEAVTELIGGDSGISYPQATIKKDERKPFMLPSPCSNMRRVFAYLLKQRRIDQNVLSCFAQKGLVYEDAEHHNAVFVGLDESGVAKHAHMRSTHTFGDTFRINVESSNPAYSFHWIGSDDKLYVFEAPIDLLSFISLYQKEWQTHSYVALCGTASHAILKQLDYYPITQVYLCLDNDIAGIAATQRIRGQLMERKNIEVNVLLSEFKDWNEDLKSKYGISPQPSENTAVIPSIQFHA